MHAEKNVTFGMTLCAYCKFMKCECPKYCSIVSVGGEIIYKLENANRTISFF